MKPWITIAAVGRRGLPTALVMFLLACGCGSDAGRVGGGFSQAAVGVPTTNLRDRCVSDFDPETDSPNDLHERLRESQAIIQGGLS